MILPKIIEINDHFVGRDVEIAKLQETADAQDSQILVVFGRRRVGKTELLEQTFRDRNIIKIEGIQGLPQGDTLPERHVLQPRHEPPGSRLSVGSGL